MRIAAASHCSSLMSNSLAIDFVFSDSGVAIRMVGRLISVAITASIPVGERKRRDVGWLLGSSSVGLEHPGEFFYPFPFSEV